MARRNPQWNIMLCWLGVALGGVGMIVAPGIAGIDIFSGGGALIFLGLLLVPVGLIVAGLSCRRARILQRLFDGNDLLAHWTYAPDEWLAYAQKDHRFRSRHAKQILFLVIFFCALFGLATLVVDFDAGQFVLPVLLGVLGLMVGAAWLSVWLPQRRNASQTGEVFLSAEGLWLSGELHTWTIFGARLEEVTYAPGDRSLLSFTYSAPGRGGTQYYTVLVPIPRGQDAQGATILQFFASPDNLPLRGRKAK